MNVAQFVEPVKVFAEWQQGERIYEWHQGLDWRPGFRALDAIKPLMFMANALGLIGKEEYPRNEAHPF